MFRITPFLAYFCLAWISIASAAGLDVEPAYPATPDGKAQYAAFPLPTNQYEQVDTGIVSIFKSRIARDPFNLAATIIFFLAIIHTFAAGFFNKLAHKYEHLHDEQVKKRGVLDDAHPDGVHEVSFRGTLFHFLGEIEAVFGMWVIILAGAAVYFHSWHDFQLYLSKDRNFTEPLFVVIIMAVAASRPVLRFAENLMAKAAALGKGSPTAWWFSVLVIAPVLGSFITEPAAMTIAALLLAKRFYRHNPSPALAYGTLGLLFVSISIGGTFTNFAAPPVLMVAGPWKWSTAYMFEHFGWKALIAILISTSLYFVFFRKALAQVTDTMDGVQDGKFTAVPWNERETPIPVWVTLVHLGFLLWTVYSAHYPVLFIGGFLFFLAFVIATRHHQNEVSLRSPILVGFFLGALVIHGGCQSWWIEPVIKGLSTQTLMLGATILTAFNDNAAITYLAAQVPDISTAAKYAVVAGAVTGGGLTVIANAPNPAGQSILSKYFKDGISPLGLAMGAIIPTIIAYLCFTFLPSGHAGEKEAVETPEAPIHQSASPE
jgi:Na+/H+ antiporter NhaD/arsenite permease-like protein